MQKFLTVDASVFISSLIPSDPYYKISRQFFSIVKKKHITLCTSLITLFEILHGYFRVSHDSKKTDDVYQKIIDANIHGELKLINPTSSFLVYFVAHHQLFLLKTSDVVIAITAHLLKQPLITWDKKLLLHCKKHIKTITPKQFLQM